MGFLYGFPKDSHRNGNKKHIPWKLERSNDFRWSGNVEKCVVLKIIVAILDFKRR